MRQHHLCIEQPDQEAAIDFLSFHTGEVKVEGVTVKVKLEFDQRTGNASLSVYATQEDGEILIDEVRPVATTDDEEEDGTTDDENGTGGSPYQNTYGDDLDMP